jgi:hypothetical protein
MRTAIVSLVVSVAFVMAGAAWAAEGTAKEKKAGRKKGNQLFNGKDLKGWHVRNPGAKMSWKVENGVLINDLKKGEHGVDLITDKKFGDCELHIEFRVPKDGNSGVYLRGRYEVQVCDSFGDKATAESCGAIYGQKAPSENASLKPGEWQTYDITLKGKTISVIHNGKLVIDKYELPGPTGGALDDKVNEPGPLMLQGDHTAVEYRNIVLKPLKK